MAYWLLLVVTCFFFTSLKLQPHAKPSGLSTRRNVHPLPTFSKSFLSTQDQSKLLDLMLSKPNLTASEVSKVNRPLVYLTLFCSVEYIDLTSQLLTSLYHLGGYHGDLLFITEPSLKPKLESQPITHHFQVHFLLLEPCAKDGKHSRLLAAMARMRVFEFREIRSYHPLLYLDADILVVRSLAPLLALQQPETGGSIFAVPEHTVCSPYHGGYLLYPLFSHLRQHGTTNSTTAAEFFRQHISVLSDEGCNETSLNTGVLLMSCNDRMAQLCQDIVLHVSTWIQLGLPLPKAMEQPFISYQVHRYRAFNSSGIPGLVQMVYLSNPNFANVKLSPTASIVHFPMRSGSKRSKIQSFMRQNRIHFEGGGPPA